jgi:hypothetical protein
MLNVSGYICISLFISFIFMNWFCGDGIAQSVQWLGHGLDNRVIGARFLAGTRVFIFTASRFDAQLASYPVGTRVSLPVVMAAAYPRLVLRLIVCKLYFTLCLLTHRNSVPCLHETSLACVCGDSLGVEICIPPAALLATTFANMELLPW